MMMTEKIEKLQKLTKEINSVKEILDKDMFDFVIGEFKKRGFVTDPRGNNYNRSLYNPELGVSIHIGNISKISVAISVIDTINGGMNWGKAYHKLNSGTQIRFNYIKNDFEKFYNTTFKNRVKKLNDILGGL
jgi:hypothetical protein